MDFSSGITVVNSVSRRTSVVSGVNHNKRVLLKKKILKKSFSGGTISPQYRNFPECNSGTKSGNHRLSKVARIKWLVPSTRCTRKWQNWR